MAREAYLKVQRYQNPTMRYLNSSGSTILAGQIVKIDVSSTQCIAGVVVADIANGETGIINVKDVFAVPCGASQSFANGDIVYWNNEGQDAIPAADANGTDDFVLGSAYKATTGEFVWVALNDGPSAYTRNSSSSSSSSSSS